MAKKQTYEADALKLKHLGTKGLPVFDVEGRYRICIGELNPLSRVSCCLVNVAQHSADINSGECLALKTWYNNQCELSIGTRDEIPGIEVTYLKNGIEVVLQENATIDYVVFQLAWLTKYDDKKQSLYTWFAADPTCCGD